MDGEGASAYVQCQLSMAYHGQLSPDKGLHILPKMRDFELLNLLDMMERSW